MTSKSKSIKNLLFTSIGQIVMIFVGLLLPRLYMVGYGSEVNGLLSSLNQFLVYLSLFEAGIGATTLQALYGPIAKDDWGAVNGVLTATDYYYKRASRWYFVSLILLALIYPSIARNDLSYPFVFGVVFFSGIGNVFLFRFQAKFRLLLQADGKNYVLSNLSTIITVAINLLKAILLASGWNVVLVLFVSFFVQMTQVAYIPYYVRRYYPKISNAAPNYEALKQKNYMLLHQISGLVFHNTDVLLITFVCGLKAVSVYSIYKLVITHLESVLNILTSSLTFVLGQTFQTDIEKYKWRIDIFESYYSAIAFALFSVALYLFLPFMKLYTEGITDVLYVDVWLPALFVLIALLTVCRTPMLFTINFAGHFKLTTPQSIFESVINLSVSILCVFFFGIYGVLFGTICALLYRTNDIIIYANKRILKRAPWTTYGIYFVNSVTFLVVQMVFLKLFKLPNTYVELLVVGSGATLVAVTLFIFAQTVFMSHCRQALMRIVQKEEL